MSLKDNERFFLGVARSATGRAWCDRLDERGSARALTIAQRLGVPELLARILYDKLADRSGFIQYRKII